MRWTSIGAILAAILLLVAACQNGSETRPRRGQQQQSNTLYDSVAQSYKRLQARYRAAMDTMPADVQQMVGHMQQMHDQMSRMHQQMMGGQSGRGRMGPGMHQQMRGGQGVQARGHEWHQQMQSMHEGMAQMHEQAGRSDMAVRHRQMAQWHQQLSESVPVDTAEAPAAEPASGSSIDGAALFAQNCASCHGSNGKGLGGVFPPLQESEWVTGDKKRPIRIVLHGLQGRIEVEDRPYNGLMPAFGGRLSNAEVAALLTYVRSLGENEASAVSAEEVQSVRDRYRGRSRPWSPGELRDEGE